MKKEIIVVKAVALAMFVIFFVVIIFSAIENNGVEKKSVPYSQISFKTLDEDFPQLGAYFVERSTIDDRGAYKNSLEAKFAQPVCFGYFSKENYAVFYSKTSHKWEECSNWGRSCLCLKKR